MQDKRSAVPANPPTGPFGLVEQNLAQPRRLGGAIRRGPAADQTELGGDLGIIPYTLSPR
jgi:hypothetical protein